MEHRIKLDESHVSVWNPAPVWFPYNSQDTFMYGQGFVAAMYSKQVSLKGEGESWEILYGGEVYLGPTK